MKSHAKDYLLEYSETCDQPWLKYLIQKAIETNADIPDDVLSDIYETIIDPSRYPVAILSPETASNNPSKLLLKSLTHTSGVNALADNQTIYFSNDCTVLYGANGTGKSGYFRILNEVSGGNIIKEIKPNIFDDISKGIDVTIRYETSDSNGHTTEIHWNNTTRAIHPLNNIRVFDASYQNGLLGEREHDQTLLYPSGLHLFPYLVTQVKKLRKRIESAASGIGYIKPEIDCSLFSDNTKMLFTCCGEQPHLYEDVISIISQHDTQESTSLFSTDMASEHSENSENNENDRLAELLAKIEQCQKEPSIDKIKRFDEIINTIDHIIEAEKKKYSQFNMYCQQLEKLSKEWVQYSEQLDEAKKRYAVLESIPDSNSMEWNNFIKAGRDYQNTQDEKKDICIYCRQLLSETAVQTIKTFNDYLDEQSNKKFQKASSDISMLKLKIVPAYPVPDVDQGVIPGAGIIDEYEDLKAMYSVYEKHLRLLINQRNTQKSLIKAIDTKPSHYIFDRIDINPYIDAMIIIKERLGEYRKMVLDTDLERQETLKDLRVEAVPLQEKQSIISQKIKIKEWLSLNKKQNKLNQLAATITTNQLTALSKTVSTELITDKLIEKFNDELSYMLPRVKDIYLAPSRGTFGEAKCAIYLKNDRKLLQTVLSEGEQKAVALSLFLAEAQMQPIPYPVVFDDPITSLDHKVARTFLERLLALNNQSVVFTHNALFIDALNRGDSSYCHICGHKDINQCRAANGNCGSTKGKHIYTYDIQAHPGKKGIIAAKFSDTAANHLKKAKHFLDSRPCLNIDEAGLQLRLAVEALIDEKILLNQPLRKFSSKIDAKINWTELAKVNENKKSIVEQLSRCHGRVSGGDIHFSLTRQEDKPQPEELLELYNALKSVLDN